MASRGEGKREAFRQLRERMRAERSANVETQSYDSAVEVHAPDEAADVLEHAGPAAAAGEYVYDADEKTDDGSPADEASTGLRAGLLHSKRMEAHVNESGHPERPARVAQIVQALSDADVSAQCTHIPPRSAEHAEVELVHSSAYIELLQNAYACATSHSDDAAADEPIVHVDAGAGEVAFSQSTYSAALLAAGCVCEATTRVLDGEVSTAFAVVRPPGHHACCDRAMGFCYFNNVSIAARQALQRNDVRRVLIFDFDVHHGNGVQDIHYEGDDVLYISLHRFQAFFFPGTGSAEEVGTNNGEGYTVNIPWPETGMSDGDYLAAFDLIVEPIVQEFAPDLILISAGFDAGKGDPLGGMALTEAGYMHLVARIMQLSKHKRCIAALEGGYNLATISQASVASCRALLGQKPKPLDECSPSPNPCAVAMRVIREVSLIHARYWSNLATPEWEEKYQEYLARMGKHTEQSNFDDDEQASSTVAELGSAETTVDDDTLSARSEGTNTPSGEARLFAGEVHRDDEDERGSLTPSRDEEPDVVAADEAAEALASMSLHESTDHDTPSMSTTQTTSSTNKSGDPALRIRLTKRKQDS